MIWESKFDYIYPSKSGYQFFFPYPVKLPDISSFYSVIKEPGKIWEIKKSWKREKSIEKIVNILNREVFFAPDLFLKKISRAKYYIRISYRGDKPTPPLYKTRPGNFRPKAWTQIDWYRGPELIEGKSGGKFFKNLALPDKRVYVPFHQQVQILEAIVRKIESWYKNPYGTSKKVTIDWGGGIQTTRNFFLLNYRSLSKNEFISLWLANQLGFIYGEKFIPGLLEEPRT